jgi:4-aminobutyrate aminotransferase/(S)-3-amino-2-methylpropionate transaminase
MSRSWAGRLARVECSMLFQAPTEGPPDFPIIYASSLGSNVVDVDGNRFVDFAAGFGAILLGHNAPRVAKSLEMQAQRAWTGLGDVFPADAKVAMVERVASLYPKGAARVLLCQSGSDAVTAAIKTAVLHTRRHGIVAFRGAYHGMGYAALSACGYRDSFRAPFAGQLNPNVRFAPYPHNQADIDASLQSVREALATGDVAAILVEPVLGRGGCVDPPNSFLPELAKMAREAGALLIADEIWTGLGRAGAMLASSRVGVLPDIFCLGKGLGGGLPISACLGSENVMNAWQRNPGVVHTSTFQGNALACSTGVATIDSVRVKKLDERSARVGQAFQSWLRTSLEPIPAVKAITGAGLMVGVALDSGSTAAHATRGLLQRGYIVVTGGMNGEVLTLTPPLTIEEDLLEGFVDTLAEVLKTLA